MSDLESFVQSYGYGALFLGTLPEGETALILAGLMAHKPAAGRDLRQDILGNFRVCPARILDLMR
jgi:hypothetical protein